MKIKTQFLFLFVVCCSVVASAQKYITNEGTEVSKTWKGQSFTSQKTFIENIAEAPEFSITANILENEALREALENQEMVTLFAVADSAYLSLPKKRRDSILGNAHLVNAMVKYLAVPGRLDSHSLRTAIEKNGGKAYLTTLEGHSIEITEQAGQLVLVDGQNNRAHIIATDFYHKNGFFHIIDGVLLPPTER